MRNYIILNNQNSNTISGLIIQELAPISKPLQRTQVETIDGRDGDIVTPLGYAAYNKKIKIGLYGNFDINEVIAYFATKGTVIFSNEPDKYYYYQIVDQIDYERLVRYRVATVTMHVQPFKYSATEGTITVDSSDTVSGEGSEIALDGTAEAPFNVLRHKGNAEQKTLSGKNICSNALVAGNTSIRFYFNKTNSTNLVLSAITNAATASASVYLVVDSREIARIGAFSGGANQRGFAILTLTQAQIDTIQAGTRSWLNLYVGGGTFSSVSEAQIEAGSTASDYEEFCGGTPSPSPDYPQDIQVLTGDSTVKITGKNLWGGIGSFSRTHGGIDFTTDSDGTIHANGTATATAYSISSSTALANGTYITLKPGTYRAYVNIPSGANYSVQLRNIRTDSTVAATINSTYNSRVFTIDETIDVAFRAYFATGMTADNVTIKPMLSLGPDDADYEPYKGQSYVLPFGDTYLAKIGDYADEPVNVDGTWYIRRAIGKVVFDGTEEWQVISSVSNDSTWLLQRKTAQSDAESVVATSNDYLYSDLFSIYNCFGASNTNEGLCYHQDKKMMVRLLKSRLGDTNIASLFQAWLSTHNTTVYYRLATPTDEVITDQSLIDALDDFINQAHAYKGHTHITTTAADGNAPAVLAVDVNEDNESIVTNAGNTTSRPILTIYGQGDIGVYINDVEVLDIALGDEEYITLDSVEMEAYKDTTANLKNRLVTGDYSKLALNAGANKIRFTGKVTKYEISKYSRWL